VRAFLTGGTGLVGRALVHALVARGDSATVLSRRSAAAAWPGVAMIHGDPTEPGPWQDAVAGHDAVVNLAGERIVDPPQRWTASRKEQMRRSRIDTTRNLVMAIRRAKQPPGVLVSGSAVGIYGDCGDAELAEEDPAGNDYLARLAADWEAAAREAEPVTRVVSPRFGLVLSAEGGALPPMLWPFRLSLGGSLGSGKQWWSWIHLHDAVSLLLFTIDRGLRGAVNATAPQPVTAREFARTLGKTLRRPAALAVPAWALRLALGEAADALLFSQRVLPRRALHAGFQFRFTTLEDGLLEAVDG